MVCYYRDPCRSVSMSGIQEHEHCKLGQALGPQSAVKGTPGDVGGSGGVAGLCEDFLKSMRAC